MGYCVQSDVEDALGHPLPPGKDVSFLIETASDCIDGFVNTTIPSPWPTMVTRIAAEVVANVLNRPQPTVPGDQPDPYNASAFQYTIGPQSLGPWLNASQQARLDVLRVHLRAMPMFSETTGYFTRFGIGDLSTSTEFSDMLAPPPGC